MKRATDFFRFSVNKSLTEKWSTIQQGEKGYQSLKHRSLVWNIKDQQKVIQYFVYFSSTEQIQNLSMKAD